MRPVPRRLTVLVACLLVVAGVLVGLTQLPDDARETGPSATPETPGPTTPTPSPPPPRPGARADNAVLFLVDDMGDVPCRDTATYLPRSARWLRDQGVCYESASTASPACCPARAQLQSGRLPHNNGVMTQLSARRLDPTRTVQHVLSTAGIRTYGIGKNLNGISPRRYYGPQPLDTGYDEFDFWSSYIQEPDEVELYADDGTTYTPQDGQSSSQIAGDLAARFVEDRLADRAPFYMSMNFFEPHTQIGAGIASYLPYSTPEQADADIAPFRCRPERDARDKLLIFRTPIGPADCREFQRLHDARLRALLDVDVQIARVLSALEEGGLLDRTLVLFTSDNGYTDEAQSNWKGKSVPYPAATDVPLLVRYPSGRPATSAKQVGLIDLAPTLLTELGVEAPYAMDGHALQSDRRRRAQYYELARDRSTRAESESGRQSLQVPTWRMVQVGRTSYVEWFSDDGRLFRRELYRDPAMTRNLLAYPRLRPRPHLLDNLHFLLTRLAACSGTVGTGSERRCA